MPILKFFLVCIVFGTCSYAQQDSLVLKYDTSKLEVKEISENDLEYYQNNPDFNYVETIEEDSFATKTIGWLKNIITQFFEAIFGIGQATGLLYFIFRIFPYLLLGILIFMFIKFFLNVNSKTIFSGQQKAGRVIFSDDENIIKNEDIQTLINNAINQKNYRLAIRYNYLIVLKQLTKTHEIVWEKQKTNEDYIKEINKDSLKENFKIITKIYDYIWYGELNIDALKFETLKTPFETITKSIKTH